MTLLSSGKHEDLTTDPTPWRSPIDGSRYRLRLRGDMLDWDPRAGYNRYLTNPRNRVLMAFRKSTRTARQFERDLYEHTRYWCESYSSDELYHARAVLSRMINLEHA